MTFTAWTVAAGLVVLAPCAPHAATEANFGAATTADLVNLCTAAPDNYPVRNHADQPLWGTP